jgi:hypothetical protein
LRHRSADGRHGGGPAAGRHGRGGSGRGRGRPPLSQPARGRPTPSGGAARPDLGAWEAARGRHRESNAACAGAGGGDAGEGLAHGEGAAGAADGVRRGSVTDTRTPDAVASPRFLPSQSIFPMRKARKSAVGWAPADGARNAIGGEPLPAAPPQQTPTEAVAQLLIHSVERRTGTPQVRAGSKPGNSFTAAGGGAHLFARSYIPRR